MKSYKGKKFNEYIKIRVIVGGIMLIVILMCVIIVSLNEKSTIYLEGAAKSIPLIKDEMMSKLGEKYMKLEKEYEEEIKRIILGEGNRTNKKGEKIVYGVNGKENKDMLQNTDYVNGVKIKYIKSDNSRGDGESNFNDIIAVISSIYGENADAYEEEIEKLFEQLYHISHSYSCETTDLYSCEHGCEEILYYCSDVLIQGEVGGEIVGHYNTDLKYSPFQIKSHNKYRELEEYYEEMTAGKNYEIDVGFEIQDMEGICEVDSEGKGTFGGSERTIREFAGCRLTEMVCYHGEEIEITETEEGSTYTVYYCPHGISNEIPKECSNYNSEYPWCTCVSEEGEEGDSEEEEETEGPVGCSGYYCCSGHEHYNCQGHVLVCCFGHCTLNIEISTLYHEGIIKELENLK